ncbi:Mlr7403 protein [invertebrate metagenome]|uniref:Mlr7403 protein n=1 Tax=invertebrate metagenome TaxID=1711999 RepID=A0A484H7B5_9ZZZZ
MPDSSREAAFIHEVNKDLRDERLQQLWRQYSHSILTIVVSLMMLIGGYETWKKWQNQRVAAYALRYDNAIVLIESGRTAEGTAMLAALAAEAGSYRIFAALRRAAILAKQEDPHGLVTALAVWQQVAADSVVPMPYREAAALLIALNGTGVLAPSVITALLEPLITDTSPWRFSALEMTAILAVQRNDLATAHHMLTHLADDPLASTGIRSRASTLQQTLNLSPVEQESGTR